MSEKFYKPVIYLFLGVFCFLLSGCSWSSKNVEHFEPVEPEDQAQTRRYRENISVKAQNEDFITYEYKDVRVDELGFLAADHCQKYDKDAYLREILLYRNHLRRATFDCTDLANNK